MLVQARYQQIASIKPKIFDFNLETLRGVAALIVVWEHLTVMNGWIDPAYSPAGIWAYTGPGHLSVLVFFLLSGYVIGLSQSTPLSKETIPTYLRKRFVRIYPIYLLCLLLALLVAERSYPLSTIVSHLTMTQGLFAPVMKEIGPAWSLTYEILFYLLFIPISFFRINPLPVAVLSAAIGVVAAYLHPHIGFALLPSYAFGFSFWLCGLVLAKYLPKQPTRTSYAYMLSFLFLFMAIGKLDAPVTFFHQIGLKIFGKDLSALPTDEPSVVAFRDFGYLPYCLVMLAVFASKEFRYRWAILWVLLLLPAVTYQWYFKHRAEKPLIEIALPTIFHGLSVLLFLFARQTETIATNIIKWLVPTGAISYGLYIVHFPIIYVFNRTSEVYSSGFTFVIRLILFLVLAVGGAYLLEKKFQPWIKEHLI